MTINELQAAIGILSVIGCAFGSVMVVKAKVNGMKDTLVELKQSEEKLVKIVQAHHQDRSIHIDPNEPLVTEKVCHIQHAATNTHHQEANLQRKELFSLIRKVERNQIRIATKLGVDIPEGAGGDA